MDTPGTTASSPRPDRTKTDVELPGIGVEVGVDMEGDGEPGGGVRVGATVVEGRSRECYMAAITACQKEGDFSRALALLQHMRRKVMETPPPRPRGSPLTPRTNSFKNCRAL